MLSIAIMLLVILRKPVYSHMLSEYSLLSIKPFNNLLLYIPHGLGSMGVGHHSNDDKTNLTWTPLQYPVLHCQTIQTCIRE